MNQARRPGPARAAGFALLAFMAVGTPPDRTSVGFDATGLKSLRYGSTEYLAAGDLQVNAARFTSQIGATVEGDMNATLSVDESAQQVTKTFSWGSVRASYRALGTRVDVTVVVTNRTTMPLQRISVEPISLRLPSPPSEYDGVTPMMAYDPGEPRVLPLHFASGTVVLTSADADKPLLVGFPWSSNRPANTVYPLRLSTDLDPSYPALFPRVVRPIAPGTSDQFAFSLRFGAADSTPAALAPDVYAAFARLFPPALAWPDRRPIGQLVLATTAAGWATNPRGWLLEPNIDVTSPAGLAAFRTAILAWADRSVAILKELNAQGMITWDIEGEQFPQPTTYLCDPQALSQAAPEMDAIADAYFQTFRNAGLRVGVCVRPQRLMISGTRSASQQPVDDPAQLLIDKIDYAKRRWGATIFYIDSNGDPNLPIDAAVFQRVLAAHPDVLLVPEHENTRYYAYTAPYREMRQRQIATPASVRQVYPGAFGLTYVADGDFTRYGDAVKTAVQQGDVLLTRAWFADPANAQVIAIYKIARLR